MDADLSDANVLASQECGDEQGPRQANTVPEPTSLLMLGVALLSICVSRTRAVL